MGNGVDLPVRDSTQGFSVRPLPSLRMIGPGTTTPTPEMHFGLTLGDLVDTVHGTTTRQAGGTQPVMPGYLFSTLGGGDNYLGNRDGEIESWHNYGNPESTGLTLAYVDPTCSQRPMILERFG